MPERVAIAVLWRGPELIMEERWEDTGDGEQETFYAFPGGKVKPGENIRKAAAREALEETGIVIIPERLGKPDILQIGDDEGYIFAAQLEINAEPSDDKSTVVWSRRELMEHKNRGKLMPFTNEYVERFF